MQLHQEAHTTHLLNGLLRAVHLYLQVSPRLLITKRHPLARAQKGHCQAQEATLGAMFGQRRCKSSTHQARILTMFPCSPDPPSSSRALSKRLRAYILHISLLHRSCNFRRSDLLLEAHLPIRPWHNNSRGKLSNNKDVKLERQDAQAIMAQGSPTLSGQG